jgi:hypothetical protein
MADGTWAAPRGGKRHITDAIADGAWAGQRCFIIGGGPSLRGFDFSRIRGERTIAVNSAYLDAPWADIMFSMDMSFFRMVRAEQLGPGSLKAFGDFKGIKCFLEIDNHTYPPPIHYVRGFVTYNGLPAGLKSGLWTGANSGFGALMLAYCLRASPICLLGFDMTHLSGRSHYHNRYRRRQPPQQVARFRRAFEHIAPAIKAKGIEVLNLSASSAMRCFAFKTLEEVLNGRDHHELGIAGDPAAEAAVAGVQGGGGPVPGPDAPRDTLPEMRERDVPEAGAVLHEEEGVQAGRPLH